MEGPVLATICFTLVVVAIAFPALILMLWSEAPARSEEPKREAAREAREVSGT